MGSLGKPFLFSCKLSFDYLKMLFHTSSKQTYWEVRGQDSSITGPCQWWEVKMIITFLTVADNWPPATTAFSKFVNRCQPLFCRFLNSRMQESSFLDVIYLDPLVSKKNCLFLNQPLNIYSLHTWITEPVYMLCHLR